MAGAYRGCCPDGGSVIGVPSSAATTDQTRNISGIAISAPVTTTNARTTADHGQTFVSCAPVTSSAPAITPMTATAITLSYNQRRAALRGSLRPLPVMRSRSGNSMTSRGIRKNSRRRGSRPSAGSATAAAPPARRAQQRRSRPPGRSHREMAPRPPIPSTPARWRPSLRRQATRQAW